MAYLLSEKALETMITIIYSIAKEHLVVNEDRSCFE